MKNEEKLLDFKKEIQDGHCVKKKTVKKTDLLALDKAVYLWLVQQRCKGTPISGPLLVSKVRHLYPLVYLNEANPSSFKPGTGRLKRFKDRLGVRAQSVRDESLSVAAHTVEPFKEKLSQIMEEKSLTLQQVFNCDESGFCWRLMPNKTLVSA